MTDPNREKLRDEIEQVYQTSLLRKYWGFIGRGIARLVGKKSEAPLWVSTAIVMVSIQVVTQIVLAVLKEPIASSPVSILNNYPILIYIWFGTVVFQGLVDHFMLHFKTTLVDALNLPASEAAVARWLKVVGRSSFQLALTFLFMTFFAFTTIFVIFSQQGTSLNIAVFIFNILLFSQMAFHVFWIFIIALTFITWIRNWKFNLFPDDPSRSYVIQTLHQVSSSILLIIALLMALNIILVIPLNLYSQAYLLISISVFWVPALLYFALTEGSFSHLIREAKLDRLTAIQRQVMDIENTQDMKQKEPAEAVQRLLDLHDRVKVASVSMINLNSVANLLGSLALPLLAFLINVFDIWQKLLNTP